MRDRAENFKIVKDWVLSASTEVVEEIIDEYGFDWAKKYDFSDLVNGFDACDAYNMVCYYTGGCAIDSWDSWYYIDDTGELTDDINDVIYANVDELTEDLLTAWEDEWDIPEDLAELLNDSKSIDDLYDLVQNGYQSEMVYIYDNIHNHTFDDEYGGDGYGYFEVVACPKIVDMCRVLDMLKRTKFCGVPEDKYGEVYNEIADSSINLVKVIVEKAYEDKPKHVSIERYAELFIKERWCK